MNLLKPVGLLALLTIPPVILLYLLRLKRVELRVPSVMLWRTFVQDMQASHPFQKLRFSILLLLQIAILVLTSLALARPYYQAEAPTGRSLVVILDASLSMQAADVEPSRFEAAREEARRIARELEPDDEMMVVLAGARTEVLTSFTRESGDLQRALNDAGPSDCRGSLREALALAMSLSREKENTRVYVLSDGATPEQLDVVAPEGVEVSWVKFGERSNNVAITALNVRESYGEETRYELFVAARNFTEEDVDCQVEISRDGDLVNVESLHLPAGEQVQHIVDDAKLVGGIVEARLDASDDLAADNVARIVFRERERRRVLIVSEGNPWVERAFAVDPKVEALVVAPGDYDPEAEDAAAFDLTVFDRWAPPTLPRRNAMLIRVAPPGGPVRSLDATFENPTILDWDRQSPLLEYVDLGPVTVGEMMTVETEPWARSIVDTRPGPLVVGETESFRCVFLGFALQNTNFPVRIAFPIFMRNALQWLTSDASGPETQSHQTGSPIRIPLPDGVDRMRVTYPDGAEREVVARPSEGEEAEEATQAENAITFDDTAQAGVYTFRVGDEIVETVAFNVSDPEESDPTPAEDLALAGGAAARQAAYVKSTREIWRWLVLGGLALLCVEWLVFHRRIG